MAVDKVLPLVGKDKENIEDFLQAVVAARCWLIIDASMPHDGNAGFFQVCQKSSALVHRALQKRPMYMYITNIYHKLRNFDFFVTKITEKIRVKMSIT